MSEEVVFDGTIEKEIDPEEARGAASLKPDSLHSHTAPLHLALAERVVLHATGNCAMRVAQVSMQRAVQESLATAKTDQIQRDAELARSLTAEYADMPADLKPAVEGDVEK